MGLAWAIQVRKRVVGWLEGCYQPLVIGQSRLPVGALAPTGGGVSRAPRLRPHFWGSTGGGAGGAAGYRQPIGRSRSVSRLAAFSWGGRVRSPFAPPSSWGSGVGCGVVGCRCGVQGCVVRGREDKGHVEDDEQKRSGFYTWAMQGWGFTLV